MLRNIFCTILILFQVIGKSIDIKHDPGCGSTKGCFYDCTNSGCNFTVSWKDVGNDVEFEVKSKVTSGTAKWIALGFSANGNMVR